MKKTALALSLFLSAAGIYAQTVQSIPYRAVLLATNEPTPVVDSKAKGIATIWLHLIRDSSGKVTSGTIDFIANYQFTIPETVILAHIHRGPAGDAGAVVIPDTLPRFDEPTGVGGLPNRRVAVSDTDGTSTEPDTGTRILADPCHVY